MVSKDGIAEHGIIKGGVTRAAGGEALPDLQVEAWTSVRGCDGEERLLGKTVTGPYGEFRIPLEAGRVENLLQNQGRVSFRLFRGEKALLLDSAERGIFWDPREPALQVALCVDLPPGVGAKPREHGFIVRGQVAGSNGRGKPGLFVAAFDEALGAGQPRTRVLLGGALTNDEGCYSIQYQETDLALPAQGAADLKVEVFESAEMGEPLAASPLILQALEEETLNLLVGREALQEPSEFELVSRKLGPLLSGLNREKGWDPEKIPGREITRLSARSQVPEAQVRQFLRAEADSKRAQIAPEVLYGLYRANLPQSPLALALLAPKDIDTALRQAQQRNLIGKQEGNAPQKVVEALHGLGLQAALDPNAPALAELRQMADFTGLGENERRSFFSTYTASKAQGAASPQEFWTRLQEKGDIEAKKAERLRLAFETHALSLNNMSLVRAITADAGIRGLSDLAAKDAAAWNRYLEEKGIAAPPSIPGKDAKEKQAKYARILARLGEDAAPTAALSAAWERDASLDREVSAFFKRNPSFAFEKQGLREYLKSNPRALEGLRDPKAGVEKLAAVQNLFRIVPRFERFAKVKTLFEANLHSAHAVKSIGQEKFVQGYAQKLGGVEAARQVYWNAAKVANTSLMTLMKYAWDTQGPNPYVIPGSDPALSSDSARATLAELFGNLDFCACKHCRSVYSPAAYLADLLLFLNGATAKNGDTGLERFFARRPDVGNILLNCENTHTPMPYIDLVNEVLEDAISPRTYTSRTHEGTTVKVAEVPQTRETRARILRAYPEYLNRNVYDTALRTATYPWNLPFSLWAEEARVYLKQMGVSRAELMETFTGVSASPTALDTAVEALGLLPLEKNLVTTGVANAATLKTLWGVGVGTLPTALIPVAKFIDRAAISYEDLLKLLQCAFIRGGTPGPQVEIRFDSEHPCSLDHARLENLTLEKLDRMHRFLRLAKRLGMGLFDLDRALAAFNKDQIDDDFLIKLAGIRYWLQRTKAPWHAVLAWFSPRIGTRAYAGSPAAYTEVFLNAAVGDQKPEVRAALTLNAGGTEIADTTRSLLHPDFEPVVLASAGMTSESLALIIAEDLGGNAALNLASLSQVYRVGSFCRSLKLQIRDYYILKRLSGISPLATPVAPGLPGEAKRFLEMRTVAGLSGLNPSQLAYLLAHHVSGTSGRPLPALLAQRLSALRQDLLDIRNENRLPQEGLEAVLAQKLAYLLPGEAEVNTALALIQGNSPLSQADQQGFIETHFAAFLNAADAKTKLAPPLNTLGGDVAARQTYVLEPLLAYLLPLQSRQYLVQKTAETLQIPPTAAEALLQRLKNPADASQSAFEALLGEAFVTSSAEMSEAAFPAFFALFERLLKAGVLLSTVSRKLGIGEADRAFVIAEGPALGWLDFNALPLLPVASPVELSSRFGQFSLWVRSYDAARRIFLAESPAERSLGAFIRLAADPAATPATRRQTLAEWSGWPEDDIAFFVTHYGFSEAEQKKADWLIRLETAFALLRRLGVKAAQGWGWNRAEMDFDRAAQIRFACKAKYEDEKWLEIAPTLRDPLREKQRDALLAYVMQQKGFVDADAAYGHYLIDVQMSAVGDSSRIVLANSAVQLFVQRILMGLEAEEIEFTAADAKQWQWRKNYRVWEAARKVFLYAENWIWPELRDDQSPFFRELAAELSQVELSEKNVEKAYIHYLKKLDKVANLEIAGVFDDTERKILHVFARTPNPPHRYYYRKWVDGRFWTAWEFVDLDIEGDHLIPMVHNRRLFLFWPKFAEKSVEPSGSSMAASGNSVTPADPLRYYEIRMAWSQYEEGNWAPVQVSRDFLETKQDVVTTRREEFYFTAGYYEDGTLVIRPRLVPIQVGEELATLAAFYYNDVTDTVGRWYLPKGDMNVVEYFFASLAALSKDIVLNAVPDGDNRNMQWLKALRQRELKLWSYATASSDGTLNTATQKTEVLLERAGEDFRLVLPHQYPTFRSQSPLFYRDGKRSYFIVPRDEYAPLYTVLDQGIKAASIFTEGASKRIGNHLVELGDSKMQVAQIIGPQPEERVTAPSPGLFTGARAAETVVDRRAQTKAASIESKTLLHRTAHGYMAFDAQAMREGAAPAFRSGKANASPSFLSALPEGLVEGLQAEMERRHLPEDIKARIGASEAVKTAEPPSRAKAQMAQMRDQETLYEMAAAAYTPAYFYPALEALVTWRWVGKSYRFQNFYHPFVPLLIKHLNRYGVEGILAPRPDQGSDWTKLRRQGVKVSDFQAAYSPTPAVQKAYPSQEFDFSYGGAYSQYNWELFFHIPLTIADRLMQNQDFAQAQKWLHYLFDPTETEGPAPKRFWKIKPFHTFDDETSLAKLLELLSKGDAEMEAQVEAWENDPFNPHLIARMRPLVYMKAVVMKYLDNLIAWGDFLFRQDTMESLNEATQLYVLAGQILGRRPVMVEKRDARAMTFNDLLPDLDRLSNALVGVESSLPPAFAESGGGVSTGASGVLDTVLYFCLPVNEKLLGYWDKVADRLFKIRNGMNIEGVRRSLSLFAPPIDPGMLVKARAAGLDLADVLSDIGGALPAYRFTFMLSRAVEFTQEVKALGAALLAALERRDAEDLSLLLAGHQVGLLESSKALRRLAVDEAGRAKRSLEEERQMAALRERHYGNLDFMNAAEITGITLQGAALIPQIAGAVCTLLASSAALAPDFQIGASGFGGSPHVTVTWGSSNLERSFGHFTSFLFQTSAILNNGAAIANAIASYQRRSEEWGLQRGLASQELRKIDQQILAADIRIQMAETELTVQDQQIENARSEEAFLRSKFSNRDLYQWMVGELSTLYFQSYQLAYDLAKRAEKCFRHELALSDSDFIRFGYWDNLKKGLLAGERLLKDLRRLEAAYLEKNRREQEILQHVSLLQLDPIALLRLQQTGACEFAIPEAWFDLAYPGHYLRRLKSVALTLPCVTGPYTSISAKLTLVSNRVRMSTETSGGYAYTGLEDSRFTHGPVGVQSIATSSAQRDSGLFELNFRDERYLPFEGAGAVSAWRLELPGEFPQFDYGTVSDAVLHLGYTARDAGEPLRGMVEADLLDSMNKLADILAASDTGLTRLLSMAQGFGPHWHAFLFPPAAANAHTLAFDVNKGLFPAAFRRRNLQVSGAEFFLILEDPAVYPNGAALAVSVQKPDASVQNGSMSPDSTLGGQPGISVPFTASLEAATDSLPLQLTAAAAAVSALAPDLVETRDGKARLKPSTVRDIVVKLTYTLVP